MKKRKFRLKAAIAHRKKEMSLKSFLFKEATIDEKNYRVTAIVSDDRIDRDGEVVVTSGLEESLKDFMENPLFLWNHSLGSGDPDTVIGRVIKARVTGKGLKVTLEFEAGPESKNKLAVKLWGKVLDKLIKSFSIGFVPKRTYYRESPDLEEKYNKLLRSGQCWAVHTKGSLVEVSLVKAPSNTVAIMKRLMKKKKSRRKNLTKKTKLTGAKVPEKKNEMNKNEKSLSEMAKALGIEIEIKSPTKETLNRKAVEDLIAKSDERHAESMKTLKEEMDAGFEELMSQILPMEDGADEDEDEADESAE